MARYRLLTGIHQHSDGVIYFAGVPVDVGGGRIEMRDAKEDGVVFRKVNQIVESDVDLVRRFGPEKFAYLDSHGTPAPALHDDDGPSLMNLKKDDLIELAMEEGVELADGMTKVQIVEVIRINRKNLVPA